MGKANLECGQLPNLQILMKKYQKKKKPFKKKIQQGELPVLPLDDPVKFDRVIEG